MEEKWQDRLRAWICSKIGHKFPEGRAWAHDGKIHCDCLRCRKTISSKQYIHVGETWIRRDGTTDVIVSDQVECALFRFEGKSGQSYMPDGRANTSQYPHPKDLFQKI